MAAMRCNDMIVMLERLGFTIRDGKKEGHKIVLHSGILNFHATSFTCGHGRNPEIKSAYITNLLKVLRRYEAEILGFLEKRDEH